ncbi:MAG: Gfo/Idh/MocA family oxidoreductase, partial [Pseudomonadota bacterium]
MNLSRMLAARAEEGRPVRVGIIGAGKFGAMYLSQARLTRGVHVLGIADLDPARARDQLRHIGWEAERYDGKGFSEAMETGRTVVTDDAMALIAADGLEVLIEATGDPGAGLKHARAAIAAGVHVVMVNVEADVVAGPLLAEEARAKGVVYSMAWGDQPALIAEHVDWARTCGFKVVCAGKGTRYLPSFHQSTPETVWEHFGWSQDVVERGRLNPKMFNSFIDGTKSGIEMTAVCNSTGLLPQEGGLKFPP